MADKNHGNCWQCEKPIEAGDEYEAHVTIWVGGGRRCFYVRKEHFDCHDYPDYDPHIRQEEGEAAYARENSQLAA